MSQDPSPRRRVVRGVLLLALLVVLPMPADSQTLQTIDFPGAHGTWLLGLNDRSDSVGFWVDGNGTPHFFIHRPASGFESIEINIPGAEFILPLSINNRGQITGFYEDAEGACGFVRDSDGAILKVEAPFPGTSNTVATGTNARGQTVGWYALEADPWFFYNVGFVRDRAGRWSSIRHPSTSPTDPCCPDTNLWGINARGVIAGSYGLPDQPPDERGFVRDPREPEYEDVEYPGATETRPFGAPNLRGELVGTWCDDTEPDVSCGDFLEAPHAFYYASGSFASLEPSGAAFSAVFGINNRGEVSGTWWDLAGVAHGYRTSRPE
jgi:hypothetical protein